MRMLRPLVLGFFAALASATPLLAHHEWLVDGTTEVTIQGTVTGFAWGNPHVMIALDVRANGTIEKWKVGGSSPQFMTTCGWDKNTVKPGDVITVISYRFRDGSHAARLRTIVMPDGKKMYYGAPLSRTADCVPRARASRRPAVENGVSRSQRPGRTGIGNTAQLVPEPVGVVQAPDLSLFHTPENA